MVDERVFRHQLHARWHTVWEPDCAAGEKLNQTPYCSELERFPTDFGATTLQLSGALVAKQVGRGWVTPGFVDQPRDSKVAEDMMYNGTLASEPDKHPYIITTLPVECEELFDCSRFANYNSILLSMKQLATVATAIDHLIVQGDAGIIGGQACAPDACSAMWCPAASADR